ncbi:MAG: hypothetical protein ACRDS9_08250 [Pseudonocardiaceae bacterium]
MPHIAMCGIGAHGHLNPSLPVITELVARGHRVSYVVPESFAQIVASTGAVPVVYRWRAARRCDGTVLAA